MIINLSYQELDIARRAAKEQHAAIKEMGWQNKGGLGEQSEEKDLLLRFRGQCGTLAVLKAMKRPLVLKLDATRHGPDIDPDIQVRASTAVVPYIRPSEPFHHRWVFVRSPNIIDINVREIADFKILGWIEGEKVKALGKMTTFGLTHRPPVYMYDEALKPIGELS